MYKNLTTAAVLGVVAVILGAFGAHALKTKLTPEALESFETAVRYQFFHVLLLLFVNMFTQFTNKEKNRISYFLIAGILLFSGSIYLIYLANVPAKAIWFITPLGGLLLIVGWSLLTYSFFKKVIKG
ncbi:MULTISPECIES: DUF423 domain-containing protein [Tenacibaculum]|uniref:DUF423 domain-containing protein n=1 Tax=Tenacibaculum discolor TaxID=361581 RepID=A0A2G1BSK9_9FLAO|nr:MULTISPECIES: DUF423 domain-containing protein [Tenacibaculum]PHO00437.1 hypothetical protein CSC82_28825 [Rhodobacteraceae bacterium 4F10]MDP2542818.1 DUF423 domain-containing protein [Tenacibaculum discolor]NVK10004.1 DUF423 domain-containing protein [Tenacibaculum sp.]PHN97017.1 hypothetical protein CSC81_11420 [Tenacibaculum discolor]RLK06932.1 uncharacterized membrane protein YgdD (TMEM256/DUF423 family) [Tenacibaculum discolor]